MHTKGCLLAQIAVRGKNTAVREGRAGRAERVVERLHDMRALLWLPLALVAAAPNVVYVVVDTEVASDPGAFMLLGEAL